MSTSAEQVIPARPRDTSEEAWRVELGFLAGRTERDLARMAFEASEFLRHVALEGIALRHPEYSLDERRYALHRLFLGDELFEKAFPGHLVKP